MNFLNGTLLIAITAIGIPIALHLIARKEPRKVLFPSVRLLSQRFESNRSKMRVRRWWLLALRIAAIASVALALARPVSSIGLSVTWLTIGIIAALGVVLLVMATVSASGRGKRSLTIPLLAAAGLLVLVAMGWGVFTVASTEPPMIDDQRPVALAIIVDNSIETSWTTTEDTRINAIREAAKAAALAAGKNSRVVAIDRSATPATFSADVAGSIAKIEAFQPSEVVQPLATRIEAAARVLSTSEIPTRQIIVISGMTAASFPPDATTGPIREFLDQQQIDFTVWDMGAYQGFNRQLSRISTATPAPAPQSPITLTAELRRQDSNGSELAETSAEIEVTLECVVYENQPGLPVVRDGKIVRPDAKPVDRLSVTLQRDRDVEVQLTLPPLDAGLHHGAVRLIGIDALAIDDASYFTIEILPPSRLLIASDQPAEANEFADLVSAEANAAPSQYSIEISTHDDLPNLQLSDFDGIVLLDPPLSVLSGQGLESYFDSGRRTFVAAGPSLAADSGAFQDLEFERRWRVNDPGTFLEISAESHPALSPLTELPGGVPFQDLRVFQYWKTTAKTNWSTLMRYAGTQHAALLENNKRGVLLMTTPIPDLVSRRPWNELFRADNLWPMFATTRELTRYVARRDVGHWSVAVGAQVALPAKFLIDDQTAEAVKRLQWFPAGNNAPVPIEISNPDLAITPDELVAIGTANHSGTHWIRGSQTGLGFSVNLPRDRINLSRIMPEQLSEQFGDSSSVITSAEQIEWSAGDGKDMLPLWSPLMLIALAVFLLEQILANRFYGQRPASRSTADATAGATA
ncbi:BatA domain-containing protein [Rhodopirellula sp. MGV]|uniref:BatA domain-containing protein n=1 Tax=Rhodopirellula sp. MGV TaxID=2023130 RepID=UPI001E29C7E0|nr:BatA domain-containing protein [Rhodopirellula sp. MGV]